MTPTRDEHHRRLERMYRSAPTNEYYRPEIRITEGMAEVRVAVRRDFFHAARAVHGSVYLSHSKRLLLGEGVVTDSDGHEIARGSGTFMPSRVPLDERLGYR